MDFGPRVGLEGGRRHDHARDRLVASCEIGDHVLDVVDPAQHRNVPDQLAAVGRRRRQYPDRPQMFDRTAFNPAQQDFGIRGAADQQRQRGSFGPGMIAHARIAEITIGKPQAAQEEHLEEPVEDDGGLAEKERRLKIWRHQPALNVGRDKGIVQHHQRERQHVRDAKNVQRIRQRNETPFRGGQVEEVADHDAEGDEIRQDAQQQRQTIEKGIAFETQIEAREQRERGRQRVMQRDQQVAQGQI